MKIYIEQEVIYGLFIQDSFLYNSLLTIPCYFSQKNRPVVNKMSNGGHCQKFIRRRYSDKLSSNNKKEYVLTTEQKDALIGIILGDGGLERAKPTHNTRLRIDQVYPRQASLVNNIYTLFNNIVKMSPKVLTRNNKKTGLTTQSMFFKSMSMPCLNYFHELFYENKIKIIPKNINELLTPIGLAHGLMGDGIYLKNKGVVLCTDSYSKAHVDLLVNVLNSKFGLTCSIQRRSADQYRIYILKSSVKKLRDIVKPFIIPSMLYKIGLLYTDELPNKPYP